MGAAFLALFLAGGAFPLRLPLTVARRGTWLLVTPRMYGIHHFQVREETNPNYSIIFHHFSLVGPTAPHPGAACAAIGHYHWGPDLYQARG